MEEVVMALLRAARPSIRTLQCRGAQIYATSQLLAQTIGFGVQPNKAIVGRNAFAHEAGIHQHGVLSNPLCYEIMTPESVGMPATASCWASTPAGTRSAFAVNSLATSSTAAPSMIFTAALSGWPIRSRRLKIIT
jgi:isopropylmalate/homocitrate/citramalate synthase